jgi:hypothetical protein
MYGCKHGHCLPRYLIPLATKVQGVPFEGGKGDQIYDAERR